MMKKLIFAALLVTAFMTVPSYAWIGPNAVEEDSAGIDTFYVAGNADVDTSEIISWPSGGASSMFAEVCWYSDSMEATVICEARLLPSGIKDLDTSFTRASWNIMDSITVTGLTARTCSLWVVTTSVPPVDVRFIVCGRNGNAVGTGGGTGGTAVIISVFKEEKQ